ncbi:MAG: CCA tRNA nucleotidyltransferase [Thermoplasmatota archaeon]
MKRKSAVIEQQVLEKVVPTKTERIQLESSVKNLKKIIEQLISQIRYPIEIELVGSTEKDTYINDNLDIDLFLCFPPSTPRTVLQEIGLSIGRKVLTHTEECFAEHPYLRGEFNGFKTEIVPCYKIESTSEKLSAVDRTPFHTKYIKKHLKETQKNEVRLLKQFLRGIGCYGAEAEVEGFSGYLCELLILKYSSFHYLLLHAQGWSFGVKLSLKNEIFPDFNTPLVFIDPVDSERNVASALSKEKFDLFVKACSDYIVNPRLTFFFPKKQKAWSISKIKKTIGDRDFIAVKIKKPKIISENLYPQVRKSMRAIVELCEQYDFIINDAFFYINSDFFYIVLSPKSCILCPTVIHKGPPANLQKNSDEFIQKWKNNARTIINPFKKNNGWYVEIRRKYVDIRELLKKQIRNTSLGKHIDIMVKNDFTILEKSQLLDKKYEKLWTHYLDKTMPWDR